MNDADKIIASWPIYEYEYCLRCDALAPVGSIIDHYDGCTDAVNDPLYAPDWYPMPDRDNGPLHRPASPSRIDQDGSDQDSRPLTHDRPLQRRRTAYEADAANADAVAWLTAQHGDLYHDPRTRTAIREPLTYSQGQDLVLILFGIAIILSAAILAIVTRL